MLDFGSSRQKNRSTKRRRLGVESLENRLLLAADPIITEFLASNDDGLIDGNGVASDWIEIYNAGNAPIDLAGWYLTDDASELDKWQFPNLPQSELAIGEYLVVFASDNDFVDPAGNLHTNFKLSSGGDYLALVEPSLVVKSEYGENGADYPEQFTDVSYGLAGTAIPVSAESIQYVDADEEPGGNTTGLLGGWVPRGAGASSDSNNFANEGGALQATGVVSEIATTATGLNPNATYDIYAFFWDANEAGWHIDAGLQSGVLTHFDYSSPDVFPIDATTQIPGSAQFVSGLNVLGQSGDSNGFSDWDDGNRQLYAAYLGQSTGSTTATVYVNRDNAINPVERSWYDGIGLQTEGTLVSSISAADYRAFNNSSSDPNLGTNWTLNSFNAAANGFVSGQAALGYENNTVENEESFEDEILTSLPSGTTSVYVRTQFNVTDASSINDLTLSLKYDDGFVAYLNGVEVASDLAPTPADFDSVATGSRPDSDSLTFREFPISQFTSELVDGQNTLAIHALNRSASSSDFLVSPELRASEGSGALSDVRYLPTPTPGSANGIGILGFVSDTEFSVDRGFYDAPFNVAITSDTVGAEIYYTFDGTEPVPGQPSTFLYTGPVLIDSTTNLRAIATLSGFEPTDVDTQTYVFLEDVVVQDPSNVNGNGASPINGLSYPTVLEEGFAAQFDLDPEIVNAPEYDDSNGANTDIGIRESLLGLPTISLTLPHEEFFGAIGSSTVGIATDATQRVRRSGSIEYFDPNTGEQFQFNAGIQAHGNSSRFNRSTPKHSFRVTFDRSGDGPGKLRTPIFENSDNDDINVVVLRGTFTDGFGARNRGNVTNRFNPLYATSIRGAFLRDTQIEAGGLTSASTYAHLYINGLYWGVYNPSERTDDAFFEANQGGDAEDYDIVRGRNAELFRGSRTAYDQLLATVGLIGDNASGNLALANQLYQEVQGNFANGTNDPNRDALLDVDNFIDYMIVHQWAGAGDWLSGNWYAARNRVDPGKGFQFVMWDQELSLDQLFRDRTGTLPEESTPGELYNSLRNLPEFQIRYADRANALLRNGGPLSPAVSQARWDKWVDLVEPGIVAESARWGDAQEGIIGDVAFSTSGPAGTVPQIPIGQRATLDGPLTIEDWRDNVDYVRNEVLEKSADILLGRLENRQLFTSVNPPDFAINGTAQHGGSVVNGSSLSISGPGAIYFTTDGSDPRAVGGAISGTLYTGSLNINLTTEVKARVLSGGQWSALSEATFVVANDNLVISEINYNPADPATAAELAISGIENDDFEFIEIMNTSTTESVNLAGMQIADGVDFTFGNQVLAPGQRAVIVENQAAFEARYGTGVAILGQWSGGLSSSGETITLINSLGGEIMSVTYNDRDPWPEAADGSGLTIQLINPAGTPSAELGKHYSWEASLTFGGTPGAADLALNFPVINEVLSNSEFPAVDAIEIYNPSTTSASLGGWFLSDSDTNLKKFQIPLGVTVGPGQFLTFDESDFNASGNPLNDFALSSSEGETLYLSIADGSGNITTVVDTFTFGAAFSGTSYGRTPDGSGRIATMASVTLGAPNDVPTVGPLVISEVNYHPSAPTTDALAVDPTLTESDLEFIEIHNPTGATVNLANWRLRGEVDFDFAAGTSLAPLQPVVVVSFDPNDAAKVAAFSAHYQVASVNLFGPYNGQLSNSEGRITLQQPDVPPASNPTFIPHVLADEVVYDDLAPWETAADGAGLSLHRSGPTIYGNDANAWPGFSPTPGAVDFAPLIPGDYDRNGIVEQNDYDVWESNFNSTIALNADGNGNGIVDAADFTVWRDNLGRTSVLTGVAGTPLPTVNPEDVDGNGSVTPLDALIVVNALNARNESPTSLSLAAEFASADVNGDGELSPIDALRVINLINRSPSVVNTEEIASFHYEPVDEQEDKDGSSDAVLDQIWAGVDLQDEFDI